MCSPRVDDQRGGLHIPEPLLVQAAIAEPDIERFEKGILGLLVGLNEVQLDASRLAPRGHCLARHLRPVIHDNAPG